MCEVVYIGQVVTALLCCNDEALTFGSEKSPLRMSVSLLDSNCSC